MLPNFYDIISRYYYEDNMALTDMICPRCGASSKEKKFVKFLCKECWVSQQKIKLPEKIIIEKCKKCGKVRISDWTFNFGSLKENVMDMCKWKGEKVCEEVLGFTPNLCTVRLRLDDVEIEKDIPVATHNTLCPDCTKLARGYYEAIIQLRSEEKKVTPKMEKLKEKLMQLIEKVTFIPKVDDFRFGFDIYVGSTRAVYSLLRKEGLKYLTTTTLATQKAGKELHRTTFLVKV
jgi:nonsense-mediated mRNA decay protein 3